MSQAAENSKPAAPGRPFKKGQSGNPGGRPKGIAARARELVGNDPERLLGVLLAIAENDNAKDSDRATAAQAYLDRGWGKAPLHEPVKDGDPLGIDDVDSEFKRLEDELAKKREAQAARLKTPGTVARRSTNGATPT